MEWHDAKDGERLVAVNAILSTALDMVFALICVAAAVLARHLEALPAKPPLEPTALPA